MTGTSSPAEDATAKVVLVTGAAQGIGAVLVTTLRKAGFRVAALDRAPIPDEVAADEDSWIVDISDEEQVRSTVAGVVEQYGRIDGLVNAAALFTALSHTPFEQIEVSEWDRTFSVNVRGPFLLVKHSAPHLRHAHGSVVLFSSNVVSFGMADFLHYVTSKAAVIGMVRSLARELGRDGVRVNALSPGFVTTEITAAERDDDYRDALVARQAIPVPTIPQEIADVVSFLLSDASRAVTGETILVNRGSHMGPA